MVALERDLLHPGASNGMSTHTQTTEMNSNEPPIISPLKVE